MKLFCATKVLVGFVDPVGSGRIEDVEVDRVFERLSLVRHIAWDCQNLTRTNHNFPAIDPELERALENIGELLVVVTVQGNNAALFHEYASDHDVSADDEVALEERIQILDGNSVPRDVFEVSLG